MNFMKQCYYLWVVRGCALFLRLDMKIKFGSGLAGLPSTYFHTEIFFFFFLHDSLVWQNDALRLKVWPSVLF